MSPEDRLKKHGLPTLFSLYDQLRKEQEFTTYSGKYFSRGYDHAMKIALDKLDEQGTRIKELEKAVQEAEDRFMCLFDPENPCGFCQDCVWLSKHGGEE